MDRQVLLDQLIKLYTQANLNYISSWIIAEFKSGQHQLLRQLASSFPFGAGQNISRIFTQLMMCYHPDRLSSILKSINSAFNENQIRQLRNFMHISSTLEFIKANKAEKTDPGSIWKGQSQSSRPTPVKITDTDILNFMSALKQKEYGNLDVTYFDSDLMSMEGDLELSGYRLRDLSGLELCQNLTCLDLSSNYIDDLWALSQLILIEELNLSSNRIGSITALEPLVNLRILDLSLNEISKIQSLYHLKKLEYVNLVGNPIGEGQLHPLRRRGVIVIR